MSLSKLIRPKTEGGVNFPDFLVYQKAFLLRQASLWLRDSTEDCPLWTTIERLF